MTSENGFFGSLGHPIHIDGVMQAARQAHAPPLPPRLEHQKEAKKPPPSVSFQVLVQVYWGKLKSRITSFEACEIVLLMGGSPHSACDPLRWSGTPHSAARGFRMNHNEIRQNRGTPKLAVVLETNL